jgi:hypothetical protein
MSTVIILGLTIIAGAVIGLAILQLAHSLIISRLHCAPLIDNEAMQVQGSLLGNAASRQSAIN